MADKRKKTKNKKRANWVNFGKKSVVSSILNIWNPYTPLCPAALNALLDVYQDFPSLPKDVSVIFLSNRQLNPNYFKEILFQ